MRFANVGSIDRIIRILIGLVFIALPFLVETIVPTSIIGIACFAVAAIMIITAIVQFCPIYGIFGLRTKAKK